MITYAKHIKDARGWMRSWIRLGNEHQAERYAALAWRLKKRWQRELKRRAVT